MERACSGAFSLAFSRSLSLSLSCLLLYHGRGVSFRLLEVGTWYRRATALIRSTLARTVHAGASDRGNAAVPRAVHDCDPFPGQPSPLTFSLLLNVTHRCELAAAGGCLDR